LHDAILKDLKVLLVEDDVESCELVEMMLSQCGAQVTCLNSGSDALTRLESESPDLLIFDIAMPGLDGYELLTRVRARGINVQAIALTAQLPIICHWRQSFSTKDRLIAKRSAISLCISSCASSA
jgi:CheY-like chemotaxis protein